MKTVVPFILSAILPGTGQLVKGRILKGLLFLCLPFLLVFFIPEIGFIFPFAISTIFSLADLYLETEKKEGRQNALKNLAFGVVTVVVIIPSLIYMFSLSMFTGAVYAKNSFLNPMHTDDEMKEIVVALENYHVSQKHYPEDYFEFVGKKPIWSHWKTDGWDNKYHYELTESHGFILTSAGEDQKLNTTDDITFRNE
jgi:hypothetical protein